MALQRETAAERIRPRRNAFQPLTPGAPRTNMGAIILLPSVTRRATMIRYKMLLSLAALLCVLGLGISANSPTAALTPLTTRHLDCCADPTCPPGCTPECAAECLPSATAKTLAKAAAEPCCDDGCCPECCAESSAAIAKTHAKTLAKKYICPPCAFCPGW
jgi:hypothetical protein